MGQTMNITVSKGDTLYKLLRERGVPENRLRQAAAEVVKINGLASADKIAAGATLELPDSFAMAREAAMPGQASLAEQFRAQSAGEKQSGIGSMLGLIAGNKVDGDLAASGIEVSTERLGQMYSNTFWGEGQGIYAPSARLSFDSDGSVKGWRYALVDGEMQRLVLEGKYNSRHLNRTEDNPARLEITTASGETLKGEVALLKDGSIRMEVPELGRLGTEPDLANEALNDLVRAPLYGDHPGGAYGHPSRFDFDPDGTVSGWRLEYHDKTGDITREPFTGCWAFDGQTVTVNFDEPVDGMTTMQGQLTPEGLTLGDDPDDRRFSLAPVKNPWVFFDA